LVGWPCLDLLHKKTLRQGSIPPTILQLGAPPKLHPTLLLLETTETNAKLSDIKNIKGD
jgi:hypothetical protein